MLLSLLQTEPGVRMKRQRVLYSDDNTAIWFKWDPLWIGSVAEWSKALDLSTYLTPSGENPREFEPRRYQGFFLLRKIPPRRGSNSR